MVNIIPQGGLTGWTVVEAGCQAIPLDLRGELRSFWYSSGMLKNRLGPSAGNDEA